MLCKFTAEISILVYCTHRYKQIVAKRLATSGANIAYKLNTPSNGPFPVSFTRPNSTKIQITFDKDFIYR